MGMAASQARFLSLTARKSNVEYEGQQVNQERTALANESSNLYAQLSKMDVPTPPNTSDFYKTVYSFKSNMLSEDNAYITYELDNIYQDPDGTKALLTHKVDLYQNLATQITGRVAADTDENYKAGTVTTVDKTETTTASAPYNVNNGLLSGLLFNTGDSTYAVYLEPVSTNSNTLDILGKDNGNTSDYVSSYPFGENGASVDYLSYVLINGKKHYLTNAQMTPETSASGAEKYPDISAISTVVTVSKSVTEEFDVERYEQNDAGRTTSVAINVPDKDGNIRTFTYELECTSVQDEDAYEQAMRDYEYNQAKYEKNVSDLNAKTEDIQQKDKTLELELKQLDTEQNAIATEMDAVTKVVEDNIEATFNTFG